MARRRGHTARGAVKGAPPSRVVRPPQAMSFRVGDNTDNADNTDARAQPRPGIPLRLQATPITRRSRVSAWLGVLIAVSFMVGVATMLVWDQVDIARVMLFGVPAQGTVVRVIDICQRAGPDDLLIAFTDAHGHTHRSAHESFNPFGCVDRNHEGDAVAIRYVPDDPDVLMTKTEIDALPPSLIIFGLEDTLVLGGGAVVAWLVLPRLWRRLTARGGA